MSTTSQTSETDEPEALLLMGRIGKPHGVGGVVKVIPETDEPDRFSVLKRVFLGKSPEEARRWEVDWVRFQEGKQGVTVLLKLDNSLTREDAEALRGLEVFAHEDDLPPLSDDEFFVHDLIGLEVFTDQGEPVGAVEDVLDLPSHLVLIVARSGQDAAMIPLVPEFIQGVDLDAGRIVVQPIEGLLD